MYTIQTSTQSSQLFNVAFRLIAHFITSHLSSACGILTKSLSFVTD